MKYSKVEGYPVAQDIVFRIWPYQTTVVYGIKPPNFEVLITECHVNPGVFMWMLWNCFWVLIIFVSIRGVVPTLFHKLAISNLIKWKFLPLNLSA